MSKKTNSVVIEGNLGDDIVLETNQETGQIEAKFDICNNKYAKARDGVGNLGNSFNQYETWVPIRIKGESALRAAEELKKGSCITVIGELSEARWKDSEGKSRRLQYVFAKSYSIHDKKSKVDEQPEVSEFVPQQDCA